MDPLLASLGDHIPGLHQSFTNSNVIDLLNSQAQTSTERLRKLCARKRLLQQKRILAPQRQAPSNPRKVEPDQEWKPIVNLPKDFDNRPTSFYNSFAGAGAGSASVQHADVYMEASDVALKVKSSNYSPHAEPILIIISTTFQR